MLVYPGLPAWNFSLDVQILPLAQLDGFCREIDRINNVQQLLMFVDFYCSSSDFRMFLRCPLSSNWTHILDTFLLVP